MSLKFFDEKKWLRCNEWLEMAEEAMEILLNTAMPM
jgi:hypothetical protein